MENYLEANLRFLNEKYKNIYSLVKDRPRNKDLYVLEQTKFGDMNVVVTDRDSNVHTIHSKYNPQREAEKWVAQYGQDIDLRPHICLYGLGLGYYVLELIKRYPDRKIFIYEPDIDIFLSLLEGVDIQKVLGHSNIALIGLGSHELTSDVFLQHLVENTYGQVSLLVAPAYEKLYEKDVKTFKQELLEMIQQQRASIATQKRFGAEWAENSILNIPAFVRSVSILSLKSAFENVPAIIVGSGPSLQQDLHYLERVKDHALIMAAGSSIQALSKEGIKPHIVVSMDGGVSNQRAFENVDLTEISLAAGSFTKHTIVDKKVEQLLHVPIETDSLTTYLFDLDDVKPKIFSTTSVTGTALQLAKLFGCKTIILMGQDLSFPKDQYYSSGVTHISEAYLQKKVVEANRLVPNVLGGENKTSGSLFVVLRDIEKLIKYMNVNDEFTFINTSNSGAAIEGTKFMTMKEMSDQIAQLPVVQIEETLKGLVPYSQEKSKQVYSKLRQLYAEMGKTKRFLHNLDEQLHILAKGLNSSKQVNVQPTLIKIDKIWKKITNKKFFTYVISYVLAVDLFTYKQFVPVIVEEKDPIKKGELINKHLGALITQIIEVTDKLEKYIDIALCKLEDGNNVFNQS